MKRAARSLLTFASGFCAALAWMYGWDGDFHLMIGFICGALALIVWAS